MSISQNVVPELQESKIIQELVLKIQISSLCPYNPQRWGPGNCIFSKMSLMNTKIWELISTQINARD